MSFGSAPLGSAPLGGTIPQPSGEEKTPEGIPVTASLVSQETEGPETKLYKISFEEYKDKECQMDGMDSDNAKATLIVLRDVGIYFTSEANYQSKAGTGVEIKHVARDGNYAALYKGLVEEDIYEIKLKRSQKEKEIDIRVFYFTLEPEKIFYIVAAKHTHIDTSKGKYKGKEKKHFSRRNHH